MLEEEGMCKAWANEAASDAQGTEGGCDGWSTDGGVVLVGVGTAPHLCTMPKGSWRALMMWRGGAWLSSRLQKLTLGPEWGRIKWSTTRDWDTKKKVWKKSRQAAIKACTELVAFGVDLRDGVSKVWWLLQYIEGEMNKKVRWCPISSLASWLNDGDTINQKIEYKGH